ncbi:MAG: hypothetical protein CMP53_06975 [Flavobacteriales bacterium]|nr:hypothetical protein [Flavobacteriales bacterium]|tara:strand:+ start:18102 stop:19727 length:1626 start_codon:yes stop_codon:yes gene_type:complete
MKKFYILVVALFFGVSATAQTHNVTFRVDLGAGAANANGVHVAGSFQGWDPMGTSLSQVGTTTVYETTVAVSPGKLEYKFLNGNAWGDDESVPAEISVGTNGNGNRWAVISQDTILPALLFAGAAPAGLKAIQFKVDMSLQSASPDSIHIAGNFQGWDPSKTMMVNFDGVHRYIAYVNPGDSVYFKFINGKDWGSAESVPSACQASTAGISQGDNRFYTDAISGLYEVCYAQCGPCVVVPTYDITVNVDVSSLTACSTIDSVTLAGPINGWGGESMSDPDNDGIYSISYSSVDSGDFQFKARYHVAGATNWEGGGNKIITIGSDSVVAPRCFGNDTYGPCATIPPTADVTFIVDFTQASFTPADTIYLMGNFTQWNSNAIAMVPHSVGGQYITTVAQYCPGTMEYRFSNGDPADGANHEPVPADCGVDNGVGGFNRFFARTGTADTVKHIYGACSFINVIENTLDEVSIYPNPMTEAATIALGSRDKYSVRVLDITGRIISAMDNMQGNVELNSSEMRGGMYFVNITNTQGALKTIKIVVE